MFKHAFRSGMSSKMDMQAAIDAGVPFGAVAGELQTVQKLMTIPKYLASGGAVFIDSGAFTAFRTGEAMDFDKVLATYETIAEMAESDSGIPGLYVVAPDAVGDQVETLRLIGQYRERLLALIGTGCNLIVPIQRGAIPAQEMLDRAKAVLGTDQFVAGIPSNEEAMTVEECATLKHHAFHILGRVKVNAEQAARIDALRKLQPNAAITADANWMRSRIATICKNADAIRSRIYRDGGREAGQASARTIALSTMLKSDNQWAAMPEMEMTNEHEHTRAEDRIAEAKAIDGATKRANAVIARADRAIADAEALDKGRTLEGFTHRGYRVAKGLCGGVGIFALDDGFQCATVETGEAAKRRIDAWIDGWIVAARESFDRDEAEMALAALIEIGELPKETTREAVKAACGKFLDGLAESGPIDFFGVK
ncbi:hypothetical protein AB4Y36_10180 [Paraburkholderia sp. BR10936]|uniref:hypothetical protein n=1 Tax=Paraburkholderia sp. BR10936 TaxID=3236993 RepID=UPI0034D389F3